jgi:hypothetical protein
VTPGTTYNLVVGTGGAAAGAGGDSTFNATTCIAKGGGAGAAGTTLAGGAGGTAGSGAAGTGTTKFSGGTGATGATVAGGAGGGGAGNAANAGTAPAAGATGGGAGGAQNVAGTAPGGGGGGSSTTANGAAGARGSVLLTYGEIFYQAPAAAATLATTRQSTVQKPYTTAATVAVVMSRVPTLARSFNVTVVPITAIVRIMSIPRAAALVGLVADVKKIIQSPRVATATFTASVSKRVPLAVKTTAAALAASVTRSVQANRAFTVAATLGTIFNPSIISARSFTQNLTFATFARVDIPISALNRITGGGTTIVKKVFNYVFDD